MRLHVAGIIKTYTRYPYLNRLIHTLLTNSHEKITREIADFFVKPLVDSQSKILPAPTAAEADNAFRAYALHGIGWCMCMVEMQPEEVCTAMTERFSTAIVDLGTLDILDRDLV
jgi:hypothetical protein